MKKFLLIVSAFLLFAAISCQNLILGGRPEILTAEYDLKSHGATEQGFLVFLVISNFRDGYSIDSIILNNRRFVRIQTSRMTENEVFTDQFLILNSEIIQNFVPPPADNRKDGIIFDIGGKKFYKEINFKPKKEK